MSWGQPVRDKAYWDELRRRANKNLSDPRRTVRSHAVKDRRSELERATALEIQLGHDVLERRELNKYLNRLLLKREDEMTSEEHGAAEELQHLIDQYDYGLSGYTDAERRRFVRLWNKSQKQRYKL
jgi:hypothetical protein